MSRTEELSRVALITGAASGIGAATARRLAQDCSLALVDRNSEALASLVGQLPKPDRVWTAAHDVADEAAWAKSEAAIRERFGRLDLAVVNAGVADAAPIAEMDFAAWRRVMTTNLDGAFLTVRATLRLMPGPGSVVVVSSAAAVKAEPGVAAYGASKAAVLQLMRVAAKESAAKKIRVNAILPGGVETPMFHDVPMFKDMVRELGSTEAAFKKIAGVATPMGRYAKADEIAGLIAFLLSDDAGTMTGSAILTDGGYTL
jgi:NAD(P)-dependent dehydrogenase (short-subunit alcohol dehydrogenase family)